MAILGRITISNASRGTPTDEEVRELEREIVGALEGDSNDAEHDALVSVAQFFGIDYDPDAAS